MLINILGDLGRNSNEEQSRMVEEYLNNNIILDSGYSIDTFINPQLVININRSNQVLYLYTNVGSKINQIKVIVPDYGKVWYYYKAIANIFSLTYLVKKYIATYYSHKYCYFAVHNNRGILKFKINK